MSDLDNEEIEATKKLQEKTADEMLEELGYRKYMENEMYLEYINKDYEELSFFFNDNTFFKDATVEFNYITMQELKAINKKCQELRLARLGEIMEIWKDIKDYEGLYQASNVGRIRSVERYVKAKNNSKKYMKSVILKGVANDRGYYMVVLSKEGKKRKIFIHRLIAETFIKNPKNYNQVNHKDEDKTNNNVSNLEWCNCKYNCNYGTRNKRIKENRNAK